MDTITKASDTEILITKDIPATKLETIISLSELQKQIDEMNGTIQKFEERQRALTSENESIVKEILNLNSLILEKKKTL
jgi:TolA-binding protein